MDGKTYNIWNKMKSIAPNGSGVYHCADTDEKRCVYELANAGFITVLWKTALDAVFHIAGETN